jgi:hypothetical protein
VAAGTAWGPGSPTPWLWWCQEEQGRGILMGRGERSEVTGSEGTGGVTEDVPLHLQPQG